MNTEAKFRGEKSLKHHEILTSSPNDEFDDIIDLAAYITDSPISLISILEGDQQLLKSHRGIDFHDIPLSDSLCGEVVMGHKNLLVVEDVREEEKYRDIPLLKTLPDIVFYAGIPLVSPCGEILGSLCVLDKKSKSLDKKQISALKSLGHQVVQLLELRQTKSEKDKQFRELQQKTQKVRNIIEATQVGTWEWNVQTNEFDVNDRWAEMLGYSKKELEPITIDTWYKLVSPEDIPFSDKKLNECLENKLEFYNVECRMKHRDGHYIWINDRARVIEWTDDGKALIMTGTHTDITERKTREIQFNTISNNIPGAVFRYKLKPDGSDEIKLVTKGAHKLWGISAEQAMENIQLLWERFHPDDVNELRKSILKSADDLSFWEHEWRYYHRDGGLRWHRGAGNPMKMEDGSVLWDSIIIDITESKETQQKLDAALASLSERLKEQNCLYRIASLSNFDYGIEELLKKAVEILPGGWLHPEFTSALIEYDDKAFKSDNYINSKWSLEVVKQSMDKVNLNISISLRPWENSKDPFFLKEEISLLENVANHLILYINQIISRNRLEVSREKYQSLIHTIDGIVWEAEADTLAFTYISPQVESILGYPPEVCLAEGDFWQRTIHPDDRKEAIDFCKSQVAKGVDHRFQYRAIDSSGKVVWISDIVVVIKEAGNPVKLRGIMVDITKQKLAEQKAIKTQKELSDSERKYKTLFNSSPLPKWLYNLDDYQLVAANDTALDFFHISENQISSLNLEDLMAAEDWKKLKCIEKESEFNDRPFQFGVYNFVTKNKKGIKELKVDLSGHFMTYDGRKCAVMVGVDVTEKEKYIQLLKESNLRFQKVSQATNDAIWDWDIENNKLYWGEGFGILFGYSNESLTPDLDTWNQLLHPEDRDRVIGTLNKILKDPSEGKIYQEYRFLKSDGKYAYVIDMGLIIRNEEGKPIRMVGALSDITYRKEHEDSLRRLNLELQKHSRELEISNAELEQFAYVASHDLQEPLRMVTGFMGHLQKKYGPQLDEKANQYIYYAVDGAQRMRQIILDLLEYSRVGRVSEDRVKIDLNELIEEYRLMRRKLIREKSAVINSSELPVIHGYLSPIKQVFHNLLDNAIKYSRKGVSPKISIEFRDEGNRWQFSIEDNGIGIDKEYFDKIFILFQRLHSKEQYGGTGIGLTIVKKIIDNLEGKIWLDSSPGKGSTFYFEIPKNNNSNGKTVD